MRTVAKPEYVEVKIPGVLPETIPARELAEMLVALETAIVGAMGLTPDEQLAEPPVVSLVGIRRGSTSLQLLKSPRVLRAYTRLATAVAERDVGSLPPRAREGTRLLARVVERRGIEVQFRDPLQRRRVIGVIRPDTDLFAASTAPLKGETTLYGKVERVGGATPRLRLQIEDGRTISCDISRALAKELGKRLYEWVGVAGTAEWNPVDLTVESFRVERVLAFQDPHPTEAFERLSEELAGAWDDVDDVVAEVTRLRHED